MNEFNEKLSKYYTLKNNYRENVEKLKTNLFEKKELSKKEKRKLFSEKQPQCINCFRDVGTIFEIENQDITKILKAKCGDKINPCPLNLELKMGYYLLYTEDFKNALEKINNLKVQIILLKNNLMFHYGNKIEMMKKFNEIKEELVSEIELYEFSLSQYDKFLQLKDKERNHNHILNEIENAVDFFQSKCKEYINDPSKLLLEEIINIYLQQIIPLIEEKHKNNYHLIKTIYDIENIEMIIETPEIIHWVEGMPIAKKTEEKEGKEKMKKPKEKTDKPKKVKTIKVLEEEKFIKPKKTLKKKIGKILLEEEKKGGEIEETIIKEEPEEEKKGISFVEDKNEIIYEGAIEYPSDYFEQDGEDDEDEDEEDIDKISIGDIVDINFDVME